MNRLIFLSILVAVLIVLPVLGQDTNPVVTVSPTPVSALPVSREQRAEAYAKLLEGQRYIWTARKTNSSIARRTATRLAEDALRRAAELDPNLAEAYTALAELSLRGNETDIEVAISYSAKAVSIDPDNFGGHKFLGRLYTLKSGLGRGSLDSVFVSKAIESWKQVTRLDGRNAEAWAFLSMIYKELGQKKSQIESLRKWLASAETLDDGFYTTIVRGSDGLAPEGAAVKLGEALLEDDQGNEAVTILSGFVGENPENLQAVDMLGRALENADRAALLAAAESLRRAVYSNPENVSLNQMLAETLAKLGDINGASEVVKKAVVKMNGKESSGLFVVLGDIYTDSGMVHQALESFRKALESRGVKTGEIVPDADRGFTLLVINKMVQALQTSGRITDAELIIDDSRQLFSNDDFVLDREKVSLLRSTGRRTEALGLIRSLRQKAPDDYNLIRKEAEILTDLGKVDDAAMLVLPLIEAKPENSARSIKYDDFVNRLFIAGLYIRAGRAAEALVQAEKALEAAEGVQSKQLASLRIASALQIAGDFELAEKKLHEILKATPNNPMALNDLGFLYLRRGTKFEEALGLIERAVSIDPRNPEYLDTLGLAHLKLGNLDEAESFLRKALRYDFTSATAYEHLGDVLREKGKVGEAQGEWRKALIHATNVSDVERIEEKIGL